MKKKTIVIAARVPEELARLMDEYCRLDGHINFSDLIRDAIREKIQRDAPQLYAWLFKAGEKREARKHG